MVKNSQNLRLRGLCERIHKEIKTVVKLFIRRYERWRYGGDGVFGFSWEFLDLSSINFVWKHVKMKYQVGLETKGRDGANEAAVRAISDGDLVLC